MTIFTSLAPPVTSSADGLTYRRYRGTDDLPGMQLANQRLRVHCGQLEPTDRMLLRFIQPPELPCDLGDVDEFACLPPSPVERGSDRGALERQRDRFLGLALLMGLLCEKAERLAFADRVAALAGFPQTILEQWPGLLRLASHDHVRSDTKPHVRRFQLLALGRKQLEALPIQRR